MSKDKRLFARLDLDYADHPKVMMLTDAAFRAHITFLLYSRKYMTDGIINNRVANRVASQWDTDVLTELTSNDEANPSLVELDNGDYYLHGYEDMQETRAEIEARTHRNRRNGAKGGRPRKPKETQSVSETVPQPSTDKGTQNKAETETETETEVSSKELTTRAREAFEFVWSSWPKKTEKKKSLEQFVRAAKSHGLSAISQWVVEFGKAYAVSTDPQYVPALAVWLRNERWTDDLPQPPRPRQPEYQVSRADEANDFINRLEAIDATRGGGEAARDYPQLRQ